MTDSKRVIYEGFRDALADYLEQRATRDEAVSRIARRYLEWAAIFERHQP